MDEIGHFFLKQYVYGILASSNAVSTDITYYDEKLMQRSYNQMDNNEVVTEEVAAVVENNTGIEIEPLFEEQVDFDTFSKSDFRVVKVKIVRQYLRVRNFLDLHLMMVQRMKELFFQEYMHFTSRRNL